MWQRSVDRVTEVVDALLRRPRLQPVPPLALPVLRPAPPVLVSVGAPVAPEQDRVRDDLTWSQAWSLAWRGELLVPVDEPVVLAPPPPLPPRPRRSKGWLFSVLLGELQAGVVLGAVWEVVRS